MEGNGACLQFLHETKDETMRAGQMWKILGAKPPGDREDAIEHKVAGEARA